MEFDIPDTLTDKIKSGDCALFLGSGLSIAAGFPTWKKLLKLMIEECKKTSNSVQKDKLLLQYYPDLALHRLTFNITL